MISFEFHLEKWHEKNQKPLWFLGFPNRYLFRFAMLCYLDRMDAVINECAQNIILPVHTSKEQYTDP